MSFKKCVTSATNLTDEDTEAVLSTYADYIVNGVAEKEATKRSINDVLASVKADKKKDLAAINKQLEPAKPKALGDLDTKLAAENLWKLAQGSVVISVPNMRKATGVSDVDLQPARIRELLDTALAEINGAEKQDLPTNERKAVEKLKSFAKQTAAIGSLKKQVIDLPRPVELKTEAGKGLTGPAAQAKKMELVGETAEEVATSIVNNIESGDPVKLQELVADAVESVSKETKLKNYLNDLNTDPATLLTLIEAIQGGRLLLKKGDDVTFDRTEVVNAVVAESNSELDTDGVNALIDALLEVKKESTQNTAISSLMNALRTSYGVSAETTNNLAAVINDITKASEKLTRGTSLFEDQKTFAQDRADVNTDADIAEEAVPLYEYDAKVKAGLERLGIRTEGNALTQEIVNARVETGKMLSEMTLALTKGGYDIPNTLVLNLSISTLHPTDPVRVVLEKANSLGYTKAAFTGRDLGPNRGTYRVSSYGTEADSLLRTVLLDSKMAAKALSSDKNAQLAVVPQVLAHEVVHMITAAGIRNNPKLAAKVDLMMEDVKAYLETEYEGAVEVPTYYGMESAHEFVAEAFSDPRFIQLLNRIQSSRMPGKSLWDEFITALQKFFGMDVVEGSILHEVTAMTNELFITQEKSQVNDIEYYDLNSAIGNINKKRHPRDVKATQDLNSMGDKFTAGAGGVLIDAFGNDGRATYDSVVNTAKTWTDKAQAFMLGNMMLGQIATNYNKLFDGLMDKGTKLIMGEAYLNKNNPLHVYHRALKARQAAAKAFEARHNNILEHKKRLETHKDPKVRQAVKDMYKVAQGATIAQVHPDDKWNSKYNEVYYTVEKRGRGKKAAQATHEKLSAEFNALPKEVKNLYNDMRQFFADTQAIYRSNLRDMITKKYGLDDPQHLAIAAQIRQELTEEQIKDMDLSSLSKADGTDIRLALKELHKGSLPNGPYFPLLRYGDYIAEATKVTVKVERLSDYKNPTAMKNAITGWKNRVKSEDPNAKFTEKEVEGGVEVTLTEYAFISGESVGEIESKRAYLEAEGFDVSLADLKGKQEFAGMEGVKRLMAVAESKLKGSDESKDNARVALRQALITFQPEYSTQKSLLRRKNIRGASEDMGRGLANYMKSAGWALANLSYVSDIAEAQHAIQKASRIASNAKDNYGNKKYTTEQVKTMSNVANELERRMANTNTPGKITEYSAKLGFFNYLFSISYSVVNSTQPALITLPYLSGKYGIGKSTAALTEAYRRVGGKIVKESIATGFGARAFTSKGVDANQIVSDIRDMVAAQEGGKELGRLIGKLQEMDVIGATLALEIAEAAKGEGSKGKVSGLLHKTMEMGRTMPHIVEIMNRTTTAIATYNLARGKGMSIEEATEEAALAIDKTQFDYTDLNRPFNFVRNDLLRAMTMFKIHPIGVYGLLIGNVKTLISSGNKEEARAAGKTLAMLLATHGAFAGAAGSLLLEPIKVAMGLLAMLFDDDDEMKEWLKEPEIAMRQMLYEATGSALASEALVYGAPRLAGVDMHTRLGLQSLLLMGSNEGDTDFERGLNTISNSLMGPIIGMEGGFVRGAAAIANGQGWAKGSEYFMPKGIRDIQRAARYGSVGMTDFNGNLIQASENFSALDLATRFVGFSPSVEAETNLGRGYKNRRTGRLRRKAAGLTNRWKAASPSERNDMWRGEIKDFNDALSPAERRAFRITRGALQRSKSVRKRRERGTEKGVYYNKKERGLKKDLDFINL